MDETVEPQELIIDTEDKLEAWNGEALNWNAWVKQHGDPDCNPLDPLLPVQPTLKGDAAMALWSRGREDWNIWVETNPVANVDFAQQTFKCNSKDWDNKDLIDFRFFIFPKGYISFDHAIFDDGNVGFVSAVFAEGFVSFYETNFGNGDVRFDHANFGEGDVSFYEASFGDGSVRFDDAQFGRGDVRFDYATFGEGSVSFWGASFGFGDVRFNDVIFGKGDIKFWDTDFGGGNVTFFDAKFGEGSVIFEDAILGQGDFDFRGTSFNETRISFSNVDFEGTARFTHLENLESCTRFSFEGCSFEKLFTFALLEKGRMGGPLDLRRTSIKHDVVVADIQCDYGKPVRTTWLTYASNFLFRWPKGPLPTWPWRAKAEDAHDTQRFRKLKELAVSNRNYAKALEFHAQEIRSGFGHGETPLRIAGAALAQFLYWISSKYGQSVRRPIAWLFLLWLGFAQTFWWMRGDKAEFSDAIKAKLGALTADGGTALGYSGSNMLAFIPTGSTARTQGINLLYGGHVPDMVLFLSAAQSVLSVILLFLLGLGLRNMFRV